MIKRVVLSSSWPVLIFLMLSYVLMLFFISWSKRSDHKFQSLSLLFSPLEKDITFVLLLLYPAMTKQQVYSLFEDFDQLKNLNTGFCVFIFTFHWRFFQFEVRLNPDFSCCNSFVFYWVDKVTKKSFTFLILVAVEFLMT